MSKSVERFIYAFSVLLIFAQFVTGQVIRLQDFEPDKDGMPDEIRYARTIEIGPNAKVDAVVEVTARGNGTLKVANLSCLKVVSRGSEGIAYIGDILHVEFVDITGSGFKDLLITGTIATNEWKETDPTTYETVTSIYRYDPKKKEFHEVFHHGPRLELGRENYPATAPTTRAVISNELGDGVDVIGPLRRPLGKMIQIEGRLVTKDEKKSYYSVNVARNLFQVEAVNGAKLSKTTQIELVLPKTRTIQPDEQVVLYGYQDGGFIGTPAEAQADRGIHEQFNWHFHVKFYVVESKEQQSRE